MKTRSWKKSMSALALAVVATAASAHSGMHGPGAKYDSDGNGAVSLEEYTVYLKDTQQDVGKANALFAAVDLDKDGRLTEGEFIKGMTAAKK